MNKFYEKIILGVLFFIVLYNLVNYDILEGKRRRRRKKKIINMVRPTINNLNKKTITTSNVHSINNNKDKQQDKEISILKNKIINAQRTSDRTKVISDRKMDKYIQLLYEQISNNTLKNQELKSFSEKKGRELQGNIDLLSSDLANNNI